MSLMILQACLSAVKFVNVLFITVEVSEARVGQFMCGERFKTSFLPPWTSSNARECLFKYREGL